MTDQGDRIGGARTVVVTGPAHDPEAWVDAAQSAGWSAIAWPLLTTEATGVEIVDLIDGLPDWVCITSSSALPALDRAAQDMPELLAVPFSCVGTRTEERARRMGFRPALRASPDARTMAVRLIEELEPAALVLWPHGSISSLLGDELERAGHSVLGPTVYETRPTDEAERPAGTDEACAVLLASPSAVRAYMERRRAEPVEPARAAPTAIAIGQTTALALEEHARFFEDVRVLEQPSPDGFSALLRELDAPTIPNE